MEKVNTYERKKDYSHLKERYKRKSPYKSTKDNEFFISYEEKIGLQLVICGIILTVLIIGKMFDVSGIVKFEVTIARAISNDSISQMENTRVGSFIADIESSIKTTLGIEEVVPTMSNGYEEPNSDVINNEPNNEVINETIIEKKP